MAAWLAIVNYFLFKEKMKKKNLIYLIITIIIVVILIYGYVKWESAPGDYDEFAQCLSKKAVKMYGTDWCHFCQSQKKMFGKSFKYIDYINCDKNRPECNLAGVKGYPTWMIDNKTYSGVQQLESLAILSECDL